MQDVKTKITVHCSALYLSLEGVHKSLAESRKANKPKDAVLGENIEFMTGVLTQFTTKINEFGKKLGIEGPKALLKDLLPEEKRPPKLGIPKSASAGDFSALSSTPGTPKASSRVPHEHKALSGSEPSSPVAAPDSPVSAGVSQSLAQQLSLEAAGQTPTPKPVVRDSSKLQEQKDAQFGNQAPLKSAISFARGQSFTPTQPDFLSSANIKQLQGQFAELYADLIEEKQRGGVNEAHFEAAIAEVKQDLDSDIESARKPRMFSFYMSQLALNEIARFKELAIPENLPKIPLATFIRKFGNKPVQIYPLEQRPPQAYESAERRAFIESKEQSQATGKKTEVPLEPYAEQLEIRLRNAKKKDPALVVLKAFWSLRDGFLQIPQLIFLLKGIASSFRDAKNLTDLFAIQQDYQSLNSILIGLLEQMKPHFQKLNSITKGPLVADVKVLQSIYHTFASSFQQLQTNLAAVIKKEFFLLATKDTIQNEKFGHDVNHTKI